jgi:hypothetical protein
VQDRFKPNEDCNLLLEKNKQHYKTACMKYNSFKLKTIFSLLILTLLTQAFSYEEEHFGSNQSYNKEWITGVKGVDFYPAAFYTNIKRNTDQPQDRFVELEFEFTVISNALSNSRFKKFRFFPYQLDADDNVRLFCRKRNTESNSIGLSGNIGSALHFPNDGRGADPATISASIRYPPLSLRRADIEAFLRQSGNEIFEKVTLTPITKTVNLGGSSAIGIFLYETFKSYKVSFDGKDTGMELNPSPPG